MVVTSESSSILDVFVQEDLEWIRFWLLVGWSLYNNSVLIRLVSITEMKNHRPFLSVEFCDFAVAKSHSIDVCSSINIVLDHLLEVDIIKNDVN